MHINTIDVVEGDVLIPDPMKLRKEALKDIIPVKDKLTQIFEGEKDERELLKNAVYTIGDLEKRRKKDARVR
ncbi:hypothetical protein DRN98_01825 [Methanosarcinales archaeon]|nr:MAG: hypothetical protein DRN98_01825 [Methanosarcinales archaeon]